MELIQVAGLSLVSMGWVAVVVVAARGHSVPDLDYTDLLDSLLRFNCGSITRLLLLSHLFQSGIGDPARPLCHVPQRYTHVRHA